MAEEIAILKRHLSRFFLPCMEVRGLDLSKDTRQGITKRSVIRRLISWRCCRFGWPILSRENSLCKRRKRVTSEVGTVVWDKLSTTVLKGFCLD